MCITEELKVRIIYKELEYLISKLIINVHHISAINMVIEEAEWGNEAIEHIESAEVDGSQFVILFTAEKKYQVEKKQSQERRWHCSLIISTVVRK